MASSDQCFKVFFLELTWVPLLSKRVVSLYYFLVLLFQILVVLFIATIVPRRTDFGLRAGLARD